MCVIGFVHVGSTMMMCA